MKKGQKKNKKWIKKRHYVITAILRKIIGPYTAWRYGIKVERFKEQGDRAYLILFNHQTAFDQFFVAMAFKRPVYYMATEDIFSKGWVSSLIRWLVAPIPIKKQTTDLAAVMNCIRVSKEGGTIAIAPEGNRTYSGKTTYISPAIATLAKKMKLPIALFRIEGGYGVHPRWSDVVRKGKMWAYVSQVIEPEAYAALSNEEVYELIEKGLYVDEGNAEHVFKSAKRAEYLERAMYVCPYCGLSEFESKGNAITCRKCNRRILYGEDTSLKGDGFEFPYTFVSQWYEYQQDFVNALDVLEYRDIPIHKSNAMLSEVIVNKHKKRLFDSAEITLYGDRITIDETEKTVLILPFEEVSAISVLGRNKLNIYHENKVYQLKSDKRFNALRYVNVYYRYKNISRGDTNGKFLGL